MIDMRALKGDKKSPRVCCIEIMQQRSNFFAKSEYFIIIQQRRYTNRITMIYIEKSTKNS